MFGKKKQEQKQKQPIGNSMLELLTKKQQGVVAGGPRGPVVVSAPDPIRP